MGRLITPRRVAAAALLAVAAAAGVLLALPSGGTYIYLPDRAKPVEPLITVRGGRPPDDAGGIYFVDIYIRKATLAERLIPRLRRGGTLVPEHAVAPTGAELRRQVGRNEMALSQQVAGAVALRELGYRVRTRRTGALVDWVVPGKPAAGRIQPTDVIVAVDGKPVRTTQDLRRLLRAVPRGREATLGVRRGGERLRVRLTPVLDRGRPVVGVVVEQSVDIRLPLRVRIDTGNVGGPSAGLAFALGLLERLGRDVDHGHKVAVTGALALDGTVLPIGGIEQKAIGAERAGADVFVVPAGDNAAAARRRAPHLRVIPVKSFQQALRRLATLPSVEKAAANRTFSNLPEIAGFSWSDPLFLPRAEA